MIQGIEWIIVAVIILVLLLWGPSKLPKLARSFGEAKREFEKAVKEAEEVKEEVKSVGKLATSPTTSTSTTSKPAASAPPADDKLLEVAKALGIQTEGKTRDQIAQEIVEKTKQAEQQ